MGLVLNCSNNLGNCCQDKGLMSILSSISNMIQIIQIVVPIVLLLMICVQLLQMVMNPEEKKNKKKMLNQFIAAVVVFFIPMLINLTVGMIDSTNVNFVSCLKESRNIKLSSNVTYIKSNDDKSKMIIGNDTYEKGDEKKSDDNNGATTPGEKITAGEATVGDNGVKVRENIYHKKASITRKVNRQDVVNYALSWKGKLSYSFGTTKELRPGGTCDCSQFVYQVLKHFDAIESQAPSVYCSMWGSGSVKGTTLYSDISKIGPGDVVYKYYSKYAQHVEIYLGNNRSVGCNSGKGVNEGGNVSKYFETFIHLDAYD